MTVAVKPVDWLQPFVKYSKSYRPPTIMESFLNGGHGGPSINGYAPNPYLRPERGDTYELGANILRNGIFSERDTFRFKAVGFYREITDYISFGYIYNSAAQRQYDTSYVNLDGVTRMKGLEDRGQLRCPGRLYWRHADAHRHRIGRQLYLACGKKHPDQQRQGRRRDLRTTEVAGHA